VISAEVPKNLLKDFIHYVVSIGRIVHESGYEVENRRQEAVDDQSFMRRVDGRRRDA
jgi:hypothetical protein